MKSFNQILLANRSWAQNKVELSPEYFKNLSVGQTPKYLWIGCSDSRVPETEITGTEPGELFVHRNIANQVHNNDPNLMSVVKYAVDYLKVKHIVITGHYKCGGVKAAYDDLSEEYITSWISDIRQTYLREKEQLDNIGDEAERLDRLSELSVMHQVEKLSTNAIIQNAWKRGQRLFIHGWIFDMTTGELKVLKEINPDTDVPNLVK